MTIPINIMTMILWDGEHEFPSKIIEFKQYILSFLWERGVDTSNLDFHYDLETDEFLDKTIQEYYQLWHLR